MAGIGNIIGAVALTQVAQAAVGGAIKFYKNSQTLTKGAMPPKPAPASATVSTASGQLVKKDTRVRIRVPDNYLVNLTQGPANEPLGKLGGIIFPYTPSITYDQKADYSSIPVLHSNYAVNFYTRSSVTPISISGKFTVQNEKDAATYLATVHLLRALTKMRFGIDDDAGAPPPVCRLDAYGPFMLENVPVAISAFKMELPENVDYFNLGYGSEQRYGQASVPTLSTISITCTPMYSRSEMQNFSVTDWLSSADVKFRNTGYL
jgi:hypothetical protein